MSNVTKDIASALTKADTSRWLRNALRWAIHRKLFGAVSDAESHAELVECWVETLLFLDDCRESEDVAKAMSRFLPNSLAQRSSGAGG